MKKKINIIAIVLTLLLFVCLVACDALPYENKVDDPIDEKEGEQGKKDEDPIEPKDPIDDDEKTTEQNKKVVVKLGIDLIDENLELFKDKRVGLITNATGVDSNFKSTIDILNEKVNLVALFAPEHGIRGAAQAGDSIGNEIDQVTGLTVYSLYGATSSPTKEMLDKVDIMCIDIQDVGARFYTYIYTMSRAMEACAKNNKKFIVFDRPNPVSGDKYEGNILEMNYSSGIGKYPILQRHGLTIGEIAKLFNTEYNINCDLTVIEMKGWDRKLYIDETTCPWILPSPNMPTLDTAIVYTGTCMFEGTNLSEGRGTTRPFELIGAPYVDSIELANRLNSLNLKGVYFRPAAFTPTTSKHSGQTCYGVQVHVLDRDEFEAVKTGWAMIQIVREMYPSDFNYTSTFNLLAGCSYFKEGKYTLSQLFDIIDEDTAEWSTVRAKYLIY